ncbi:hypothetical protein AM501_20310 [Aneurinibacillus migulanus]|uniref:CobW family GTP-binding protein n=1 Tax=Aneurinibacillus migulanus TaxID=47500 RepID=UPI0005B7F554|nr:GTP-binding protein [Aneurinibacillus migulanus]KIV56031.1 hypothetical protein TS64_11090 [Aneurinibacillus migulanus]KPD06554.1 hypothetical protein AM501_20310 [Aneurinibacillus migulanus]
MPQIPVVIVSGFLGSGKTTLLLRLLQEAPRRNLQPAVLMNELGTIDVDGRLVNATMQESQIMEKLLDGCICCSKKSEVVGSMEKLLTQQPDVIFVELTGVANPEEVIDMLTEPQLKEKVRFHTILTTLDSYYYLEYTSIFEVDRQLVRTVKRQVEVADIIIVNKTEDMKEAHKSKLLKALRKQNERSPIVFTTYSEINLNSVFETITHLQKTESYKKPLFNIVSPAQPHKQEHHPVHTEANEGSYSRVQTSTLPIHGAVQAKKLEKLLKTYHPYLLRAKGYLPVTGKDGMYLMQYAAKRTEWEKIEDITDYYLVLIGIDLPIEEIHEKWQEMFQETATQQ